MPKFKDTQGDIFRRKLETNCFECLSDISNSRKYSCRGIFLNCLRIPPTHISQERFSMEEFINVRYITPFYCESCSELYLCNHPNQDNVKLCIACINGGAEYWKDLWSNDLESWRMTLNKWIIAWQVYFDFLPSILNEIIMDYMVDKGPLRITYMNRFPHLKKWLSIM